MLCVTSPLLLPRFRRCSRASGGGTWPRCLVLRGTAWCSCLSPLAWEALEGHGGASLAPVSPAPGPQPDTHPETKELFMPSCPTWISPEDAQWTGASDLKGTILGPIISFHYRSPPFCPIRSGQAQGILHPPILVTAGFSRALSEALLRSFPCCWFLHQHSC